MQASAPKSPQELFNEISKRMASVKHKIIVLSGKGGVGKTFVSSMLALALRKEGFEVGIFDADIHGSSIPLVYGMKGVRLFADENGIIPAIGPLGVKVIATNLLLSSPETPVIWRGPLKTRAIIELLSQIQWGELDYLVVDLPPGTGDEALTIVHAIKDLDGAIIVTAPGLLSEKIVAKAINFVREAGVRLLGIVENMSYFRCPVCGREYNLLGRPTGEELAKKYGTSLLARIPIDPTISEAVDKGKPYILEYPDADAAKEIINLAKKIHEMIHRDS